MRPSKQLIDTFAYAQKSKDWILSEDLALGADVIDDSKTPQATD